MAPAPATSDAGAKIDILRASHKSSDYKNREFVDMMRRNLAQSLHDAWLFDFLLCSEI
jgi:hypothetical protein